MSWSYSQYVDALEREEIINSTNEETFSCLSSEGMYCKTRFDSDRNVSISFKIMNDRDLTIVIR